MITKPTRIFDRDFEWQQLAAFASRAGRRTQLGVVSGRRRQGKTFLLDAIAQEAGGLYFGATEATEAESLRLFGSALGTELGLTAPLRFTGWDEAITYLFSLTTRTLVVLDEFPYLSKASPALPSIIQREVDRRANESEGVSLLLCGSAMSVMGRLLAGNAPLSGRASLELVVHPFDYRSAASYWRLDDPRLAVLMHSVVGGTPAYRRFADESSPASPADFDDWLLRTVLNPASALFREARYLLDEETDVRDTALYHSVLGAVAAGNNARGAIAAYIGRKAADIGHHLGVLEDCGLLRRDQDVFRSGRSVYRIGEPLVTFYHAIMRPQWGLLESGRSESVWRDARSRFPAQVVGSHFEQICRDFAINAATDTFGALPGEVGAGVVTDPASRTQIQIDVAVFAPATPGQPHKLLSLGEAKWGNAMDVRDVDRLVRARDLLTQRGYDTTDTVLACYSGAGFDRGFAARAANDGTLIVDLDRLYAGRP